MPKTEPGSPGYVSIHAPAGGATKSNNKTMSKTFKFQSTRPRGARPQSWSQWSSWSRCFNPRARGGRDLKHRLNLRGARFTTRPRGRDAARRATAVSPRARGARQSVITHRACGVVSIHAPAGARRGRRMSQLQYNRFQSTRPRGATGLDTRRTS